MTAVCRQWRTVAQGYIDNGTSWVLARACEHACIAAKESVKMDFRWRCSNVDDRTSHDGSLSGESAPEIHSPFAQASRQIEVHKHMWGVQIYLRQSTCAKQQNPKDMKKLNETIFLQVWWC